MSNGNRPRRDTEDLPDVQNDLIDNNDSSNMAGTAGTRRIEPIITFKRLSREQVICNDDSYIVLGGDRLCSQSDGYGMHGETGAHMIDMVVGRDPTLSGNPSFKNDAARIYVSQRTDVDRSLGLPAGNVQSPKRRSAVAIKADGVRIVAREGIKLVTMGKGTPYPHDHDESTRTFAGIDLIANNDDSEMEPIAKANKVADALDEILNSIEGLSALTENFLTTQMQFNKALTNHHHAGTVPPAGGVVHFGNIAAIRLLTQCKIPMKSHRIKCTMTRINYLEPMTEKWIGSRYNFTN